MQQIDFPFSGWVPYHHHPHPHPQLCPPISPNRFHPSTTTTGQCATQAEEEEDSIIMGVEYGLMEQDSQIVKVAKVKSLLHILQERLPRSCNVFNMAHNYHKFQGEMTFYTLEPPPNCSIPLNDPWIVAIYAREDYGLDVNISPPRDMSRVSEFKKAFLNSGIVPWDEPFIFAATDSHITSLTQDLFQRATGKTGLPGKNLMFYASSSFKPITPHVAHNGRKIEVKPLDVQKGGEFLVNNWSFAKTGSLSYVRKLIERNPSSGVFLDGKLVAGAVLNGSGMISMLHTLKEHRNRGYAKLCMNFLVQTLQNEGFVPCCTVEVTNARSISLQRKIGLQVSHEATYTTRR